MGNRIIGFEPVCREDARILICGSMPSVKSLEDSFYYAHPRNAFWPMMAEILEESVPDSVAEKKEMLKRHHIALWDVVHSCEREGSLDTAIRSVICNDFEKLFTACPRIDAILFNGGKAYELYKKHIRSDGQRRLFRLPSTSPAYTMNYESKKKIWKQTLEEVLKDNESL